MTGRRVAAGVASVLLVVGAAACREDDPALDVGTPTSAVRPSATLPGEGVEGGASEECSDEGEGEREAMEGTIEVRFREPLVAGQPVTWTLSVRSGEDAPVTLVFPSGQDGDVVLERDGAEVYRWSEGMFFTQALRCRDLPPGATLTFELRAGSLDVEPGDYTLRATVAATPSPPEHERQVTVTS